MIANDLLRDVPRYEPEAQGIREDRLVMTQCEGAEWVRLSDVLAALSAAPHVNEKPKSEHDGADVLTAPADEVRRAALMEAAQVAVRYNSGRGQGAATARAITNAILALIEKDTK